MVNAACAVPRRVLSRVMFIRRPSISANNSANASVLLSASVKSAHVLDGLPSLFKAYRIRQINGYCDIWPKIVDAFDNSIEVFRGR